MKLLILTYINTHFLSWPWIQHLSSLNPRAARLNARWRSPTLQPHSKPDCRLSPYPRVRPAITPSHTERNPTTTLRNTFKKANRSSPSRRLWKVSSSNVENVVYAPMNPMGIRYRQFAFQWVLSARRVTTSPIKNDPEMLITNVPYGKRAPNRLLMYAPSQKRAIEPANPPSPTIQYLFIWFPHSQSLTPTFLWRCTSARSTKGTGYICSYPRS